jgi:hypothetical protein
MSQTQGPNNFLQWVVTPERALSEAEYNASPVWQAEGGTYAQYLAWATTPYQLELQRQHNESKLLFMAAAAAVIVMPDWWKLTAAPLLYAAGRKSFAGGM